MRQQREAPKEHFAKGCAELLQILENDGNNELTAKAGCKNDMAPRFCFVQNHKKS